MCSAKRARAGILAVRSLLLHCVCLGPNPNARHKRSNSSVTVCGWLSQGPGWLMTVKRVVTIRPGFLKTQLLKPLTWFRENNRAVMQEIRKSATSLTLFADACRSVGAIITECVSCTIAASLTQHFWISNMSTKMLAPYANVQVAKRWHFPYRRGNPCMQCVSEPSYPGIKHFGEGKC